MDEPMQVDVEQVVYNKMNGTTLPPFVVSLLKRLVHQDEINDFLRDSQGKTGADFIACALDRYNISCDVVHEDRLPASERTLFVSNHPLGGLDGMAILLMLSKHYESIRAFVNDMLLYIEPLKSLFIPVNKMKDGRQSRNLSVMTDEAYQSDGQLLTFPAGACSRFRNGRIQDIEWKKSFVVKAVSSKRNIVPIHFEGRNSTFFYTLAFLRKHLHIKSNIEMMFLVDEMFKQQGRKFRMTIGEPIPWTTFDHSRPPQQWAAWVRERTYALRGT